METPSLYEIVNLAHRYNGFTLSVPNLSIKKGTSIGFVGPNGCGKSTLFRILSFLEAPQEGSICFEGANADGQAALLRGEVTFLLQEPYLLKRTVFENVAYGLKIRGQKEHLDARVRQALAWVGLDAKRFSRRRWFELSGGEAQRVALASRLVLRPKVLILDEPTASVDRLSASLIKDAIAGIRKQYGTSLLIASHDALWLNTITDEILRMYDGQIMGSGSENLIFGPWDKGKELWIKKLSDGQEICALGAPDKDAIAILDPSDIMISIARPEQISAQNIIRGDIIHMMRSRDTGKVQIEIDASGLLLKCNVTNRAAEELQLLPGKMAWVIFKASSLHWQ